LTFSLTAKYSSATVRSAMRVSTRGHGQRLVAQQRGDCLQGHASVDGLRGQGVPQLVGVDVADAGGGGDRLQRGGQPGGVDPAALLDEQQVRAGGVAAVGQPVVQQRLELRVRSGT
jgi:hypothetical protein